METLSNERQQLEIKKLGLEVSELSKPWYSKHQIFVNALIGVTAVLSVFGQSVLSNIKAERLLLEVEKKTHIVEELRAQERDHKRTLTALEFKLDREKKQREEYLKELSDLSENIYKTSDDAKKIKAVLDRHRKELEIVKKEYIDYVYELDRIKTKLDNYLKLSMVANPTDEQKTIISELIKKDKIYIDMLVSVNSFSNDIISPKTRTDYDINHIPWLLMEVEDQLRDHSIALDYWLLEEYGIDEDELYDGEITYGDVIAVTDKIIQDYSKQENNN